MARLRQDSIRTIVAAIVAWISVTNSAAQGPKDLSSLYDRPVLVLDPGMHTSAINSLAVDREGRVIVSASSDKTVRIWNAATGVLEQTVHPPIGPVRVGSMYAVAIEPNGSLIAAGGWTSDTHQDSIYLIDPSHGKIVHRIAGMPNATTRLAFSADGRYLAAGTVGLRVFDRERGWAQVSKDDDYGAEVYGLSFSFDGRLATASADGLVRLYDAKFGLVNRYLRQSGVYPQSIAFSPDGNVLAVGYTSLLSLALIDGHTLTNLPGPDVRGLYGYLDEVVWSRDGQTLFSDLGQRVSLVPGEVIACAQAGQGPCKQLVSGIGSSISSIVSLPKGGIVVAGGEPPYLGAIGDDGRPRWEHRSATANFQALRPLRGVAADGTTVDFTFQPGNHILRFSVSDLNIVDHPRDLASDSDDSQAQPQIKIESGGHVTIEGRPVGIEASEIAESFAVHPDGDQFSVGTNATLYMFRKNGENIWRRYLPADARGLKITGNGRLIVAALNDGTIRWFRSDNGVELLALMPLSQNVPGPVGAQVSGSTLDWVAWTPDGFYTSTAGASRALQWLANHSIDTEAASVAASDIPSLRRPAVLALMLRDGDVIQALGEADLAAVRKNIKIATDSQQLPGSRLHILAIGISDYGPKARNLKLQFAEKDAFDVANTLDNTQSSKSGGLYGDVLPIFLPSSTAKKEQVFQALADIERNMSKGDGRDVAVVMFSGHGAKIGNDFYLLPYDVDATTTASIEASAISSAQLENRIAELAGRGLVLVILDACRSGAMTGNGVQLHPDAEGLRSQISHNGVVVVTSSSGAEDSLEDPKWNHGAFTKVLLNALEGNAVIDGRGPISVGELIAYLAKSLPALTNGAQHLGVSPDFQHLATKIFVVGK